MVKISFVCPIFNKFEYLPKVLDSIQSQIGDFDKEIIFINDGSFDKSLEFLKERTKNWKNVRIFNQKNKGPASATQKGIQASTGDYIKLVGGDDIMSPMCTNLLLTAIKKTNSVAAFSRYKLLTNYKRINFENKKMKIVKILKNPIEETIKSCFSGTTPNLYCAKSIKKGGGCDIRLFVEDFSLVLRLSKFGQFIFLDNITSVGPKNDISRIMVGKEDQLIHDYNAALYFFLKENKNLSKKSKIIACKKSLGRSEKWFRRVLKRGIFSKINRLRIKYYLNKSDELFYILESCKVFYQSNNQIRYKIDYSP